MQKWKRIPAWIWMTVAVCLMTLFFGMVSGMTAAAVAKRQLTASVLRFHVIANSDEEEDQELKKKVRDAVIAQLEPLLAEAEELADTEDVIAEHLEEIRGTAETVVAQEGYAYEVNAYLTDCYFPEKVYGDSVFPAGRYKALRITIGEAKGQNWWCLLFPEVSFADCVRGIFPEEQKEALKNLLTEEEYERVFSWEDRELKICTKWF
ncbi:MAG: stage II sporulation protein R [Eubacteriales bacterium]|nr:stage II sporulation protein R [Eubacteriales bacterium]